MLSGVCEDGAVRLYAVTCWRRSTPRPRDGELHWPRVLFPGCWAVPRPRHVWGQCPRPCPSPFVPVQCCFTSTMTIKTVLEMGSPGWPPQLSHSSWAVLIALLAGFIEVLVVWWFYRGVHGVMVLQRCRWCNGFTEVLVGWWFYSGAGGVMVLWRCWCCGCFIEVLVVWLFYRGAAGVVVL